MVKVKNNVENHYTLNINSELLEIDVKELFYLQVAIGLYRHKRKQSVYVDFRLKRNIGVDANKAFSLIYKDFEANCSTEDRDLLYSRLNKLNKANFKDGTLQIKNSKWNRDIVSLFWGNLKPASTNEPATTKKPKQNQSSKAKLVNSNKNTKSKQVSSSDTKCFTLLSSQDDMGCSACNEKAAFILKTTEADDLEIAFCKTDFKDFICVILDFYIFHDETPTMFREGATEVTYKSKKAKCFCCGRSNTMSFNFKIGNNDFSLCEKDFEKLCDIVFKSDAVKREFNDKYQEFINESRKKKPSGIQQDKKKKA